MLGKSPVSLIYAFAVVLLLIPFGRHTSAQNAGSDLKKIQGTIVKVDTNSMTVKTAEGEVTVSLDLKTEISFNEKPATVADLKEGQQVTIVTDGTKAVSVKVGLETA